MLKKNCPKCQSVLSFKTVLYGEGKCAECGIGVIENKAMSTVMAVVSIFVFAIASNIGPDINYLAGLLAFGVSIVIWHSLRKFRARD